ncbi:hypothetical protein NMY22_g17467 [Coprinellus aureogranulatus]|nr:hypothetical protein NMY22_g17467 [Coprinellus aureogranulatus]
MASDVPSVEIAISETQSAITAYYTDIAAGTLFMCDWISSLHAEVILVWRWRWTLGKTIFLLLWYGTALYVAFIAFADIADWKAFVTGTPVGQATPCDRVDYSPEAQTGLIRIAYCVQRRGGGASLSAVSYMLDVYPWAPQSHESVEDRSLRGICASVSISLMINHLVSTSQWAPFVVLSPIRLLMMEDWVAKGGNQDITHSLFRIIGNYFVFARHLGEYSSKTSCQSEDSSYEEFSFT